MDEALTAKLGPLPRWAWIVLAGGTIGVVLLAKKAKGTTGTTGQVIPELAGQALPAEQGANGGAAGSLEASEAKNSSELEALRNELHLYGERGPSSSFGAGIGEVIQAREALEALGLSVGSPQINRESSAAGGSAVKAATGKGPAFPLTSSRGKYRDTKFKGHQAHEYAGPVHGGVGPKKNLIVLGGPAKAGHGAAGSHLPAHVAKPPATHTAAKPSKPPPPVHHAPPPVHHAPPPPAHSSWHPPHPPPPPPRKRH